MRGPMLVVTGEGKLYGLPGVLSEENINGG